MRRSMHDFMEFTRASGLTMVQLNTLMRLHFGGACGVSDLGNHLGVTSAAASQLVERLAQMGLLERTQDPNDRRTRPLAVTDQGRALIQQGIEARRRWISDLTCELSAEDQQSITVALTLLTNAAQALEQVE